jgi:hypothetical protein
MSEARISTPYRSPEIRDLGTLSVLTASDAGGLHFSLAAVAGSLGGGGTETPTAVTTPGPAQNVLDNTQSSGTPTTPDVPDVTGVEGVSQASPGSGSGTSPVEAGSNGGGGGVGSGTESLPFTGMAVGPVAALGAGMTAAGAALRRRTRRP